MSTHWIILIFIYLIVSIYYGSRTKEDTLIDRIMSSLKREDEKVTVLSILKDIPVFIFFLCALIFFLPAGIVEIYRIIRDGLKKRKISRKVRRDNKERKEREKLGYLLFRDIFGAGILICKECGHQEEIVKFLHGFDNAYTETGYQCQECGKHVKVIEDENTEPNFICQCGGILKRGDLLFCSQCRSKKLKYHFRMMT